MAEMTVRRALKSWVVPSSKGTTISARLVRHAGSRRSALPMAWTMPMSLLLGSINATVSTP